MTQPVETGAGKSALDKTVLITGASGLLGLNMALSWQNKAHIAGVCHQTALYNNPFSVFTADLTDRVQVEQVLNAVKPQWIINSAAMANLEKCDENPELAKKINAEMPGWLARWAKKNSRLMIHISTDAVFSGKNGNYSETDDPAPLSWYAITKLQAEHNVMTENADAAVCRVNFYGCSPSGKRSLVEFFYNNLSAGNQVNGFTDLIFCPLFVMDLSDVLWKMAVKHLSGLYHVVSSESLTKYDFGVRVARTFGFDENLIKPISWKEGGLKSIRARNLSLRADKIQADLGEPMPGIEAGLQAFRKQMETGYPERIKSFLQKA